MNSRRRKSRSVHRPVTSPAVLSPPRSAGPETGDGAKKKRPPCSSHDAPMSGAPPSHWVFSLAITSGLGRPLGTIPRFREGSRRGAAAGERPGARTPLGINGKRRYRTQNTSEHPHPPPPPQGRPRVLSWSASRQESRGGSRQPRRREPSPGGGPRGAEKQVEVPDPSHSSSASSSSPLLAIRSHFGSSCCVRSDPSLVRPLWARWPASPSQRSPSCSPATAASPRTPPRIAPRAR